MKRFLAVLALLGASAAPAAAQNDLLKSCVNSVPMSAGGQSLPSDVAAAVEAQFEYLCAQMVNSLTTVQPSVGIAFSGGNPVLGTATTIGTRLGILPRVSATARANVALATLPDLFRGGYVTEITDANPALGAAPTLGVPVGSLQGDVVVGLFNGISPGPMIGGIGSIDLLGSVAFLPQIDQVGLSKAITNIGLGARVGILRQGLVVPGVSVSAMYRMMDEIAFGSIDDDDPGEFATDLRTLSLRAVISKGILAFDFALGAGYDKYTSDVSLGWKLHCELQECRDYQAGGVDVHGRFSGELSTAAWNVFGNVALDLLFLSLVGEVGFQKAVDPIGVDDLQDVGLPSSNPLTTDALKGGRLFGSVGLRLTL